MDVTEDGQKFLVTTFPVYGGFVDDTAFITPRIRVILNWLERLKEQVPTGG